MSTRSNLQDDTKRLSKTKMRNPCLDTYSYEEREFYRRLDKKRKRCIVENEEKVLANNDTSTPLRFKILLSDMNDDVKAIAMKKLEHLEDMCEDSGEYHKISSWIESLCSLPVGKYKKLPISRENKSDVIRTFLLNARSKMDEFIYGHKETKDYILRLLAQWIINPGSKGLVIGVHGPMGCGKTSLIKDCICRVLNLPFAFIPLGGCQDSSYLEGHSFTYEGATWGKIVDILMKSKCMNPVMYFDELDKVSDSNKGQEIINVLMHITDQSQNNVFHDKYFRDLEFDISKSLIIFSYNDDNTINPILKDRMIKIETQGYNVEDKIRILQKFIIPEILKEFSLKAGDLVFSEEVLRYIIVEKTEQEEGVRNVKRSIYDIISHYNLSRLIALDREHESLRTPFILSEDIVKKYMTRPMSTHQIREREKHMSMYL